MTGYDGMLGLSESAALLATIFPTVKRSWPMFLVQNIHGLTPEYPAIQCDPCFDDIYFNSEHLENFAFVNLDTAQNTLCHSVNYNKSFRGRGCGGGDPFTKGSLPHKAFQKNLFRNQIRFGERKPLRSRVFFPQQKSA